jgi:hypothetical protein
LDDGGTDSLWRATKARDGTPDSRPELIGLERLSPDGQRSFRNTGPAERPCITRVRSTSIVRDGHEAVANSRPHRGELLPTWRGRSAVLVRGEGLAAFKVGERARLRAHRPGRS